MDVAWSSFAVAQWGSGLLLIALGVAVGLLKPRRRPALAFALFCTAWGATNVLINITASPGSPEAYLFRAVVPSIDAAAIMGLLGLATVFPRPLGRGEWPSVLAAGAVAVVHLAVILGLYASASETAPPTFCCFRPVVDGRFLYPGSFNYSETFVAALLFVTVLLGLRAATLAPAERRLARLMSAALMLYPGLLAGNELLAPAPWAFLFGAMTIGVLALVAVLWLRRASLDAEGARADRNLAWLALLLPIVGMVRMATQAPLSPVGIARVAAVSVLAYGVLRSQLFDLDVKVKWTISRGTLAGIFIAVFFVVSQVAQNYFQSFGVLAGGVAAGLMLFALAPLQRVAERVADAAMPGVKPVGQLTDSERAAVYLELSRTAWADGSLIPEERDMLEAARARLGLSHEEALRIEREARPKAA